MKLKHLLVMAGALFATQAVSNPVLAEPRVELKAWRYSTSDKAEWESDNHYKGQQMCWLRSMNMFPIGGGNEKVAVIADLKDPNPQLVKKFSFEVWFRPQMRKNVKPSVVLEFEENGVTQMAVLKWSDFTHNESRGPDREVCTKELKSLNVKRIVIGGNAIFNHPHTDRLNESPMDVIISNVKVETVKNGLLPVTYSVNTETVKAGNDPDTIMKKLAPEKN